jgi:hypothetical protein
MITPTIEGLKDQWQSLTIDGSSGRIPAMRTRIRLSLSLVCLGVIAGACPALAGPRLEAETNRTVFVTVTDERGVGLTDLTPADFVVKEGGKEREVTKAEPASGRMRLSVAVEERLIGDTSVRTGLYEFIKRMIETADIRLIVIGLRNQVIANYTNRLDELVEGVNKFTLNPRVESQVAEGVLEMAREFVDTKPARPVMVVISLSGGQAGVEAKAVLEKLRDSGAMMFAATLQVPDAAQSIGTLSDQAGREQVLGDGPKQSGGRRVAATAPGAIPKAMLQIAADLQSQYAISYTLPDGVKPDRRFSISVKRKGVTVRAPSTIPDR